MEIARDVEGLDIKALGAPRITVIGCGGAGNNTINRLTTIGIDGAETIAVNTDAQALKAIVADRKILIGHTLTRGLGTGGDPEIGRRAAENARKTLEDTIEGSDLVIVTAGLGGGTGTGVAPVVSDIAKAMGAIVVCMVTKPFHVERRRILAAEAGLQSLYPVADTLIIIDNNRLLEIVPHLPVRRAFSVVDQLFAEIILGMAETITEPSLINLDYADVRTVMRCGGASFVIVGESSIRRPERAVRSALNNPLLDVDVRGATGCLLHITGGERMTLKDASAIASALTSELDPMANVIWGARIRRDFGERVRIMAIITGARSAQTAPPKSHEEEVFRKDAIDCVR